MGIVVYSLWIICRVYIISRNTIHSATLNATRVRCSQDIREKGNGSNEGFGVSNDGLDGPKTLLNLMNSKLS